MTGPIFEDEASVSLPAVWIGLEDQIAAYSNLFLAQVNGPDVLLSFGLGNPPVFDHGSTPEQRLELLRSMQYVPVRAVARLALSGEGLVALRNVLNDAIETRERQAGK